MRFIIKIFILMSLTMSALYSGDFLMPDEAFKPYAKVNENAQIQTGVILGKDIYIYAEKMSATLKGTTLKIKETQKPVSVDHEGEQVYTLSPEFILTLENPENLSGVQKFTLVLSYQGCSEMGLCYNPYVKEFPLSLDVSKLSPQTTQTTPKSSQVELSESDAIADTIKSGSIGIILLTFLGFGLLLAMTPCVFPMIPIISGVIVSQGEGLTTKKAFALSIVYVLSMAVAYTIAGVLAGLFGANLQAALQMPWVIYSFSLVFVALAFSMFGFYELKLPDSLVTKVSSGSNRGGYIGVAIMGFLSALIVGPCVAAPLAGALVYIGQTGDAVLGGMALFSMSIGMGLPLIAVGVSAGKFMPKPGAWMTMVSAIFGVMMLGVAIWMLEKILDPSIIMIMYSILGIGFSLYLGVFEKDHHFFKHSVAMIIFIYSISLFIGFLAGSSSMLKPLGFLNQPIVVQGVASQELKEISFEVVHSIEELDAILAANKGKKILLDFAADWCTSCKELEEITFADADVKAKMSEFVLVRADVTKNTQKEKLLSKKYGVFGPPALIFFDENGEVKKAKTIIGFIAPDEFLAHLNTL
ncbi:protein-disulfide reductase DsbD [Sulfurimonas sp. SAG-AH-194-L11]|nr:protein-disulfide reductase DsbD [Sulfurimonas sp. SAG-AH-194-L11]MDF1876943.1 protein-disulfide reductase DsbD [Sulfurimonas sp. SAG-AH-194-L11]